MTLSEEETQIVFRSAEECQGTPIEDFPVTESGNYRLSAVKPQIGFALSAPVRSVIVGADDAKEAISLIFESCPGPVTVVAACHRCEDKSCGSCP